MVLFTRRSKWRVGVSIVALIILIALGILCYHEFHRKNTVNTAAITREHILQSILATAQSDGSDVTIVNTTTELIQGANSGKYSLTKGQLAQYYLEEGSSLVNLKKYTQAVGAFQAAAKLDQGDEFAALQGEVEAGYAAGERQQLIPLLKQLVVLAGQNGNTITGSPQQYSN
jgi:tetratricopeptide (TPR) repeat protein